MKVFPVQQFDPNAAYVDIFPTCPLASLRLVCHRREGNAIQLESKLQR